MHEASIFFITCSSMRDRSLNEKKQLSKHLLKTPDIDYKL